MSKTADRPNKHESPGVAGPNEPFAEIDADQFEQARRDPAVRRFAAAADRYLAALKRSEPPR